MVRFVALLLVLLASSLRTSLLQATRGSSELNQTYFSLLDWIKQNSSCEKQYVPRESFFEVYEQFASPDSSIWLWCKYCSLHSSNTLKFYSSSYEQSQSLLLSRLMWEEFFHYFGNDKFYGTISNSPESDSTCVITNPIYLVPIITFHPGHILIDLLEQVHYSMLDFYGQVPDDAMIILDVASAPERERLQDIIQQLYLSDDFLASSVQLLTSHLFVEARVAQKILQSGPIVFSELHIGANLFHSSYYWGYRFHPLSFADALGSSFGSSRLLAPLRRRYHRFQSALQAFSSSHYLPSSVLSGGMDVLFVQRADNRVVRNLPQLVAAVEAAGLSWAVCDLSVLKFWQQVSVFSRVRIFVAVSGTSLHNVLWMAPSAQVIFFMPPLWCPWAWLYENSVHLAGVRLHRICLEEDPAELSEAAAPGGFYLWGRRTWLQPPRLSKTANLTAPLSLFRAALHQAIAAPLPAQSRQGQGSGSAGVEDEDEPSEAAVLREVLRPDELLANLVTRLSGNETVRDGQRAWRVVMEGDVLARPQPWEAFLRTSPHLSLCLVPLLEDSPPHLCHQLGGINYYSTLQVVMHAPTNVFRLFLRPFPGGGLVRGSELLLPVNCLLPQCGLFLLRRLPALPLAFPLRLFPSCRRRDSPDLPPEPLAALDERAAERMGREWDCSAAPAVRQIFRLPAEDRHLPYPALALAPACSALGLRAAGCHELSLEVLRALHEQWLLAAHSLPPLQPLPSPRNPFVFVHVDKTGGTTLKDFVVQAARENGLRAFVPCYNNVSCLTFDLPAPLSARSLPDQAQLSILAGHFPFGVWDKLPACRGAEGGGCRPSCLVIGRDPVDRVVSYYYQRLFLEDNSRFFRKRLNEVSAEDWEELLLFHRFARFKEEGDGSFIVVDEGLKNAFCRSLLNRRTTTGLEGVLSLESPPELGEEDVQQAVANMRRCVVGVLERWDESTAVIRRWFPWIPLTDEASTDRRLNQGDKKVRERREELRPELLELILRHNDCDLRVYRELRRVFEEQLEALASLDRWPTDP